jgi:hypothetical protein
LVIVGNDKAHHWLGECVKQALHGYVALAALPFLGDDVGADNSLAADDLRKCQKRLLGGDF